MAIDHQALIAGAPSGFATPLCTDHPSAIHPGYDPSATCPVFDPAAANQLLDDNGWVKGPDGVRSQERAAPGVRVLDGSHLCSPWRLDTEAIIQRNLQAIGIKLDIQNYPDDTFFGSPSCQTGRHHHPREPWQAGMTSPSFTNNFGYDPDDSFLLSCDQIPPKGGGIQL